MKAPFELSLATKVATHPVLLLLYFNREWLKSAFRYAPAQQKK